MDRGCLVRASVYDELVGAARRVESAIKRKAPQLAATIVLVAASAEQWPSAHDDWPAHDLRVWWWSKRRVPRVRAGWLQQLRSAEPGREARTPADDLIAVHQRCGTCRRRAAAAAPPRPNLCVSSAPPHYSTRA